MAKIANISVGGRNPVRIMGILNTSPESFYKKSISTTRTNIRNAVIEMENQGADFIDIGGYSSRPGAENISVDTELNRVIPIIKAINKEFPNSIISIDTFRSKVAKESIFNGVSIIN